MKRNRLIFCRQWVARMASIIETVVALVVLLACCWPFCWRA